MQVSHWFPIVSDGHPTRYPGDAQHSRAAKKIRLELTTDSSAVRIAAPGTVVSSSGRSHVYEMTNTRDFAFGASPSYLDRDRFRRGRRGPRLLHDRAAARPPSSWRWPPWPSTRPSTASTSGPVSSSPRPAGPARATSTPGSSSSAGRCSTIARRWRTRSPTSGGTPWPATTSCASRGSTRAWPSSRPATSSGPSRTYASSRPVNSAVDEFPNLPAPMTSDDPDSYNQTIYFKSARFLDGLRARMGNGAFFDGLKDLFTANRNGMLTSRKFFNVMAAPRRPEGLHELVHPAELGAGRLLQLAGDGDRERIDRRWRPRSVPAGSPAGARARTTGPPPRAGRRTAPARPSRADRSPRPGRPPPGSRTAGRPSPRPRTWTTPARAPGRRPATGGRDTSVMS